MAKMGFRSDQALLSVVLEAGLAWVAFSVLPIQRRRGGGEWLRYWTLSHEIVGSNPVIH